MTVAELCEKLQEYPQDMEILFPAPDGATLYTDKPDLNVYNNKLYVEGA